MTDNTKTKERGDRWGLHMQNPEIREKLFELSRSLNKPSKDKHRNKPKTRKEK